MITSPCHHPCVKVVNHRPPPYTPLGARISSQTYMKVLTCFVFFFWVGFFFPEWNFSCAPPPPLSARRPLTARVPRTRKQVAYDLLRKHPPNSAPVFLAPILKWETPSQCRPRFPCSHSQMGNTVPILPPFALLPF